MRVLMLTHRLPYPPNKGERIRAYNWLKAISSRHEVDLLSLADEDVSLAEYQQLKKHARDVRIVLRRRRNAVGSVIRALHSGCSVTEAHFDSRRFDEQLKWTLCQNTYDVCLVICSSMGAYALDALQGHRVLVDLIDVDSVKWQLYAERQRGAAKWIYQREGRHIASLEQRLAGLAEAVITVSDHERGLLGAITRGGRLLAIPNGVDTDYFKPAPVSDGKTGLVFVGQMDYLPNIQAVTWFAQYVWPVISGRHSDLRWTLSRQRNVTVTGEVDDVRPYLASAVSIAPLRVACGMQNKVLEAMASGRPVVASPAAACGLNLCTQEEILVADSAKQWLAAIELLLTDPTLAAHIGRRARQAMVQRFAWQDTANQMLACLAGGQTKRDDTNKPIDKKQAISLAGASAA